MPTTCCYTSAYDGLRSLKQTLLDVALVNGILVTATEQQLTEQVTVLAEQTWIPEFHSWMWWQPHGIPACLQHDRRQTKAHQEAQGPAWNTQHGRTRETLPQ